MNNTDLIPLPTQNPVFFDQAHNVVKIDMQDILSGMQEKWMLAILVTSLFLLVYVLYNSFVRNPQKFDVVESYGVHPIIEPKRTYRGESIDSMMDDWAIIPVVYLFIISITYYTGFKGV